VSEEQSEIEALIKQRIAEICAAMGEDASVLDADTLIPASGLIDSAGLLELLAWYEQRFGIDLAPEDITIDNLGTLRQMATFAIARRRARVTTTPTGDH